MINYIKVLIFILILSVYSFVRVNAQDAMYSQPYAVPMLISPSFAGLSYSSRVSLLFRDQWPGMMATYRNYGLSYDTYLERYNSGIGIMFNRNDQGKGMYVVDNVAALYSYDIEIKRGYYIRPGMKFEYVGRGLDYSKLNYYNQINPEDGKVPDNINGSLGTASNSKFDAGASVMAYLKWGWIGVTVDHLVKSNIGFTDMGNYNNIKTTVYGGTKFDMHRIYSGQTQQTLSFAFHYQRQAGFNQLMLGSYWFLNPLEIGIWYRGIPFENVNGDVNNDAVIFIAGITLGKLKFAYSYDLSLSKLAGYSGGASEFTVSWYFKSNFRTKGKKRAIPCPGVFLGGLGGNKYTRTSFGSGF